LATKGVLLEVPGGGWVDDFVPFDFIFQFALAYSRVRGEMGRIRPIKDRKPGNCYVPGHPCVR